jgi:gamma-tubulin complex component 3
VFGQRSRMNYLRLFNALWRAKRMEWILSCVWTRQSGMQKIMIRTLPELKPILHLSNLLTSEMVHFVHQLAYYTAFEVMECSWDQLIRQLKQVRIYGFSISEQKFSDKLETLLHNVSKINSTQ